MVNNFKSLRDCLTAVAIINLQTVFVFGIFVYKMFCLFALIGSKSLSLKLIIFTCVAVVLLLASAISTMDGQVDVFVQTTHLAVESRFFDTFGSQVPEINFFHFFRF